MTITELIAALQSAKNRVGDVPVSFADAMEILDLVVHEDTVIVSDYNEHGQVRRFNDPPGVLRDDEDDVGDDFDD